MNLLPDAEHRPALDPGSQKLNWPTLIRRDFVNGPWDPDHDRYFLVVTHSRSPWTTKQKNEYPEQAYAVAVEISLEGRTDLDLYALVRAQLLVRSRARANARRR